MAILKQRLNRKNSSGSYDTIYLENIATNIKMSDTDSTLLSTKISNMDTAINGKQPAGSYAAANHNHNGVYQPAGSYAAANHNHNGTYATVAQYNELKTSVSSGKAQIASAITDKGVSTAASATFPQMASNIRNIGMVIPATLPAGYTACNYIQTDGNAWINTGIDLTSSTQYLNEIIISSIFPSNTENSGTLLSAINDNKQSSINISQACQTRYGSINYYSSLYCGGQAGSAGSGETYYHFTNINKIDYYIGLSRTTISEGKPCRWGVNTAYQYSNSESRYSVYKAVIYLWKYGYNQASGTNGSGAPGSKIYEFLYYYNHELKSHMIPCRNSSGVVGLYDVVRNAFYGNAGTGSLTYG
nr:MAG TPA: hypothetical protein [Caudoviricetes sp.]